MKIQDMINYSIKSLTHSKIRTWLTILGIVIGICSVIILISIGQGLNASINEELDRFGSNSIEIVPFNTKAADIIKSEPTIRGKLYTRDIDHIKKIPGIATISGIISQRASISFKDSELTSVVYGVEPNIFKQANPMLEIEEGRFLTETDRNVVLLGNDIAMDSFGKNKIRVNNYVNINGKKFKVIGVLKKSGESFSDMDSAIQIHIRDARILFSEIIGNNELDYIDITVKNDADVEQIGEEIREEMRNLHRVKENEEDFSIITPKFINETVGMITTVLTIFLGAIASISLVVGGIGIANTMFMSVTERIKEIGILKAIGAGEKEILSIFLIESGIIGLTGGIVGILFAILILLVIKNFGVPVSIDIFVILGAFLFSFIIGIISGFIPAKDAARISPLEALRYE